MLWHGRSNFAIERCGRPSAYHVRWNPASSLSALVRILHNLPSPRVDLSLSAIHLIQNVHLIHKHTPSYLSRHIKARDIRRTLRSSSATALSELFSNTAFGKLSAAQLRPPGTLFHILLLTATRLEFLNLVWKHFCSAKRSTNNDITFRQHLWSYDRMAL